MRTGKRELYFTESVHTVLGTSATILADLRHDFYSSVFVHGKKASLFMSGHSWQLYGARQCLM